MKKIVVFSSSIVLAILMSGCGGIDGKYECAMNQSITLGENGKYHANVWRDTYAGSWSKITDTSILLEGLANSKGIFTVDGNTITMKQGVVHLECTK